MQITDGYQNAQSKIIKNDTKSAQLFLSFFFKSLKCIIKTLLLYLCYTC